MVSFRVDPREHQCTRRCDSCTTAELVLIIIPSKGDPENIQITGLSAGMSATLDLTQDSFEVRLGNCRCSLYSSNITPRFEVATWGEGTVHFRCLAVECHRVSPATHLLYMTRLGF